ncbi:hypothetical protein [Chryseolinea soli]|uniref:hypothetical protein n=1 Tax=Chryseolinea soli TaxID=2321403 RepID=UPI001358FA45|nr:hypothetical protein [Chryseolinea soli]
METPNTDPKPPKEKPETKPQPKPGEEISKDKGPEEAEDPFDFGGLPKRDLKKNLGCG